MILEDFLQLFEATAEEVRSGIFRREVTEQLSVGGKDIINHLYFLYHFVADILYIDFVSNSGGISLTTTTFKQGKMKVNVSLLEDMPGVFGITVNKTINKMHIAHFKIGII